jgi:hypothetical protein
VPILLYFELEQPPCAKEENSMLSTIGSLVNIGIVIYLGILAKSGMSTDQYADLNTAQNPLILSFAAILALLLATRNR